LIIVWNGAWSHGLEENLLFWLPISILITYFGLHQHQNSLPQQQQQGVLNKSGSMGRPKDFPNIYQDLLTKYKAKGIADKEYKEYLAMARVS
jgi:hypothetical protein